MTALNIMNINESARIEAPKRCGEGISLPLGRGLARGLCSLPRIFF